LAVTDDTLLRRHFLVKNQKRPVVLVVLDGWGYRAEREGNAIALASTPTWDVLSSRFPMTLLHASGLAVGLPEGQIGNSEVGHLNLGAGRVVAQDLVRIGNAIKDGSFFENRIFTQIIRDAIAKKKRVHLVGLIGDGGVHAIDQHLIALVDMCARLGTQPAIHAMLDGRDTMPRSGIGYMRELLGRIRGKAQVASVGGRYFGMDRDNRWERTEKWYRVVAEGVGPAAKDPLEVIQAAYNRNETDEFVTPTVIVGDDGKPLAPMRDGDAVICFNFRSDRMRQIVRVLTQSDFKGFDVRNRPGLSVVTMTMYDETFETPVAFPPISMANIVGEMVSKAGMTMLRTAETEKYAHVTYFFNGRIEKPFPGEQRILVPSQKVATYDLMPEMSAAGVTDVLTAAITKGEHDFILCNFANGDMVGHTGSLPATIAAVETVDRCMARVLKTAQESGTRLLVTADHGNCEMMIDPKTGGPHTAHTTSPVPFVVVDERGASPLRNHGALCDVGPTVMRLLGLDLPAEMTGTDLREGGGRS
jgi:2,3-bisphosphoglycerate-independent phosphoglycerate mutase